jgi:hypothetical protein
VTRGGKAKDRGEPERRCIATGESQPKAGLIRFVAGPEGRIVADLLGKLPGRGIWVSADRAALEKAVAKKLFARAAKTQVTVPEGLLAEVEGGLARRVIELISLERKAGRAVTGFEKAKDWLEKGEAAILIQASDGSERGKGKLRPPGGRDSLITCLTQREIGLSFGRDYAIHAALAAGGLANRVVEEAARLSGLRGTSGAKEPRERIRRRNER